MCCGWVMLNIWAMQPFILMIIIIVVFDGVYCKFLKYNEKK